MKKFNDIITEQFKYSKGFLDAFKEVDLGVLEIKESTWLQGLLLEDETELKEFRVYLGKYYTEEKFEDDWGNYLDKEEYQEDIDEDRNRIGKLENINIHNSDSLEFSVFLPSSVKFHDKDSPKYDMFVAGCMTQAAIYFKILKETVSNTYKDPILEIEHMGPVQDDAKLFGLFLKLHNYQITNYNIDKVHDVLYRLYKDSKFFYNLKEELEDRKYKELINEFSKVVK